MALILNNIHNTKTIPLYFTFESIINKRISFLIPAISYPIIFDLYDSVLNTAEDLLNNFSTLSDNIIDYTRVMLTFIIKSTLRLDNLLQPSHMAHALLTHFVGTCKIINPHNLTNSQWLDLMADGNMLFNFIKDNTKYDQIIRANAIVDELITSSYTTVTLMDGHGRMVFNILKELCTRGYDINKYTFKLYDLDSNIVDWHHAFLPKSVESIWDDILCSSSNKLKHIDELPGIVYFNFCGIGKSIDALKNMLFKLTTNSKVVFLSWSSRGSQSELNTPFITFQRMISRIQQKPFNNTQSVYISHHGWGANIFYTYKLFSIKSVSITMLSQLPATKHKAEFNIISSSDHTQLHILNYDLSVIRKKRRITYDNDEDE